MEDRNEHIHGDEHYQEITEGMIDTMADALVLENMLDGGLMAERIAEVFADEGKAIMLGAMLKQKLQVPPNEELKRVAALAVLGEFVFQEMYDDLYEGALNTVNEEMS